MSCVLPNSRPLSVIALIAACLLAACASSPSVTDNRDKPVESKREAPASPPAPAPSSGAPAQEPQQAFAQELEQILQQELGAWRKDYARRQRLAANCPSALYYAYGMRLIQPSSFRGDYAELVRQRYGAGTEFLVIGIADKAAAARAGILPGDRLIKVGPVFAKDADAAKTVATESRRWRQAYAIVLERDGKTMTKTLTPDKLCDVKL